MKKIITILCSIAMLVSLIGLVTAEANEQDQLAIFVFQFNLKMLSTFLFYAWIFGVVLAILFLFSLIGLMGRIIFGR
jgi:hypothetical protein